MGLANQPISISNCVDLGNNGPTVLLNNRPTLVVSRSTAEPATKVISLAGIQAVNFQSGCAAILQSASLVQNQIILFVYTGGAAAAFVTLALDNGGTVGGQAVYTLISGAPVTFLFDGTNLHS
jgi:hypothetical protein